jgi:hypothetical protein
LLSRSEIFWRNASRAFASASELAATGAAADTLWATAGGAAGAGAALTGGAVCGALAAGAAALLESAVEGRPSNSEIFRRRASRALASASEFAFWAQRGLAARTAAQRTVYDFGICIDGKILLKSFLERNSFPFAGWERETNPAKRPEMDNREWTATAGF